MQQGGASMYTVKQIGAGGIPAVKALFFSVFTQEPWKDDWSDEKQLDAYLHDLTGQSNSLTYGLYAGSDLIGVSMGHIKHWYSGTEYLIDEFCIQRDRQGKGLGTLFLKEIEASIRKMGLKQIFLQTEKTVPAYDFYRKNGFTELTEHVSFSKQIPPR